MRYNMRAIGELVSAAFSDEDLTDFVSDHFRLVRDESAVGQTKGSRIQLLLKYASDQGLLDTLLVKIQEIRPKKYVECEARLRTVAEAITQYRWFVMLKTYQAAQ